MTIQSEGVIHAPAPRFGKVPMKLMHDPTITDGAVRLFAHMMWRYGSNQRNFESHESMAEFLHVSEATISHRVAELEQHDWVAIIPRAEFGVGRQSNIYHLFIRQDECREFCTEYKIKKATKPIQERKSRKGVGGKSTHVPKMNSSSSTQMNSSSSTQMNLSSRNIDTEYIDAEKDIESNMSQALPAVAQLASLASTTSITYTPAIQSLRFTLLNKVRGQSIDSLPPDTALIKLTAVVQALKDGFANLKPDDEPSALLRQVAALNTSELTPVAARMWLTQVLDDTKDAVPGAGRAVAALRAAPVAPSVITPIPVSTTVDGYINLCESLQSRRVLHLARSGDAKCLCGRAVSGLQPLLRAADDLTAAVTAIVPCTGCAMLEQKPTAAQAKTEPPPVEPKAEPAKTAASAPALQENLFEVPTANKTAKVERGPKSKAPRKPQPTDSVFDAIVQVWTGHVPTTQDRNVYNWRVGQVLHGDKKNGRCSGLLEYETARQGKTRVDLDYLALAESVLKFWSWYKQSHNGIDLKDCAKWMEFWATWRATVIDKPSADPNCPDCHGDGLLVDDATNSAKRCHCWKVR